jgi:sialate O-acetylesterase
MKVERKVDGKTLPARPQPPISPDAPFLASNLYNGQILPIAPFAVSGAIWYQGESNAGRAEQYRTLFPAMIDDWRAAWGKSASEFPFLFVQLANFMQPKDQPSDSEWAELRDAQLMTLDRCKNTGMAVIIDIGEANNIHPANKQDVGRRLALAAEHLAYGNNEIVYSGPIYQSMNVQSGAIRLKFDHVGGGLKARDGSQIKGFAIAGEDQKFVWADAKIDGDDVIVSSKDVTNPVAVRYAWADNPDTANLINAEGLPASPFRTDDWKMLTAGKN